VCVCVCVCVRQGGFGRWLCRHAREGEMERGSDGREGGREAPPRRPSGERSADAESEGQAGCERVSGAAETQPARLTMSISGHETAGRCWRCRGSVSIWKSVSIFSSFAAYTQPLTDAGAHTNTQERSILKKKVDLGTFPAFHPGTPHCGQRPP
jgi:hypothetical protein